MLKGNSAEVMLAYQIMADKLGKFEQEYRFSARRYRLDIAFPREKVGIEVEGGLFATGRAGKAHNGGLAITRDMAKHNLLILLGWRVLRFTPRQIKRGEAIEGLKNLLTTVRLNQETQERRLEWDGKYRHGDTIQDSTGAMWNIVPVKNSPGLGGPTGQGVLKQPLAESA